MAFVIKKKNTFVWPVKIKTPVDGGKHESQEISLEFRKIKKSELTALTSEAGTSDVKFCKAIIVGWKDVTDEQGNQVEFSEMALSDLIEDLGVASAIVTGYLKAFEVIEAKN